MEHNKPRRKGEHEAGFNYFFLRVLRVLRGFNAINEKVDNGRLRHNYP